MVEAGEADVVVVAYFDRLVRSLAVQAEVVERVEQAGGAILAVDVGEVASGHGVQVAVVDDAGRSSRSTTAARRRSAPPTRSAAP